MNDQFVLKIAQLAIDYANENADGNFECHDGGVYLHDTDCERDELHDACGCGNAFFEIDPSTGRVTDVRDHHSPTTGPIRKKRIKAAVRAPEAPPAGGGL